MIFLAESLKAPIGIYAPVKKPDSAPMILAIVLSVASFLINAQIIKLKLVEVNDVINMIGKSDKY